MIRGSAIQPGGGPGFLDTPPSRGILAQMPNSNRSSSHNAPPRGPRSAAIAVLLSIALLPACTPKGPPPAITRPSLLEVDPLIRLDLGTQVDLVTANPYDAERRGRLGMAYEANELFAPAIDEYAAAATLAPTDPLWPYRAAVCHLKRGELETGRAALEGLVTRYSRFAPAWHRLAVTRIDEGDLAGARTAVNRCLSILPSALPAKTTLADLELREDQTQNAIDLLEEVTRSDPNNRQARFLLGRAYQRAGRSGPAVEVLLSEGAGADRAFVEDPREREIKNFRYGLSVEMDRAIALIQSGRPRDAAIVLERVHQYHPADVSVLLNLSQARRDSGDIQGAISSLESASAFEPDNFRVHLVRAMVEIVAGDTASNITGAVPGAKPDLALAHRHYDAARSAARIAIRNRPEEWRTHFALARASSRLDDQVEARQSLLEARKIVPTNVEVNMWLFETCYKMGDTATANAALEATVAADPFHLGAWVNLVHVRLELGNPVGAREALDQARGIDQKHARVIDAAAKLASAEARLRQPDKP